MWLEYEMNQNIHRFFHDRVHPDVSKIRSTSEVVVDAACSSDTVPLLFALVDNAVSRWLLSTD